MSILNLSANWSNTPPSPSQTVPLTRAEVFKHMRLEGTFLFKQAQPRSNSGLNDLKNHELKNGSCFKSLFCRICDNSIGLVQTPTFMLFCFCFCCLFLLFLQHNENSGYLVMDCEPLPRFFLPSTSSPTPYRKISLIPTIVSWPAESGTRDWF